MSTLESTSGDERRARSVLVAVAIVASAERSPGIPRQGDLVAVTTRQGQPRGALDVRCDVTDASVDAAFATVEEAHGPVECWWPMRASPRTRSCCGCRRPSGDLVIDTNLTGSFRVAKRAAKSMLRLRRGRLVISSSSGGGPARLRGPGELRGVESRAGRDGPARSHESWALGPSRRTSSHPASSRPT
ncbi:MAG: SDR family oxidoreductase [Nocardioides sp.]